MTETGGWGEPEGPSGNSQGISFGVRDLGDGATLELDHDAIRALLKNPEIRAHLYKIADQLAAEANALAVHVGREDRPDPIYKAAGATVYPSNYQARLDEAQNSTLYKVMAQHLYD